MRTLGFRARIGACMLLRFYQVSSYYSNGDKKCLADDASDALPSVYISNCLHEVIQRVCDQ